MEGAGTRRFKVKCVTVTNGLYLVNILTSLAPPPRLHVARDGALALINVSRVAPPSKRSLMSLVWLLCGKKREGRKEREKVLHVPHCRRAFVARGLIKFLFLINSLLSVTGGSGVGGWCGGGT